ncbi:MAG: hypothetical protein QOH89_1167, partial [Pseudonocardiales bacterium]|nr:hypothetical protein [Pseudonocardiales bacterium]
MAPKWQDVDEEDRGLLYDLPTLISRRRALGLFGGLAGAGVLAACTGSGSTSGNSVRSTSTSATAPSTSAGSSSAASGGGVGEVPDETSGPFPGDGSNGPDALTESGIVRRDITRSFGTSTTAAEGIPLTIRLTVRDAATGDLKKGAAVYLWHCDRDGGYSMYASNLTNENYLRGVQPT